MKRRRERRGYKGNGHREGPNPAAEGKGGIRDNL